MGSSLSRPKIGLVFNQVDSVDVLGSRTTANCANQARRLTAWRTARYPCYYQITQLFDAELPPQFGLARQFADELELPWAKVIRPHSHRMGSDRRWMLRTRNGELLSLKK